jgi:DNA-binding MarR family transcriptional regulator
MISIVIKSVLMEDNIGSMVADVARLMRRSFDARARDIGVTRPQWQVLTVLRRNEGVNQGKLADLLDVEPITVCRMVDRLQEADMVERRPDPADRRSWRLYLTEKGHMFADQLRPLADDIFEDALVGLKGDERKMLMTMLDRIRQNLVTSCNEPQVANG